MPYRTAPQRAGAGRWWWPRGCGVWWVWGRPLARPPVVCGGSRRAAVWLVLGGVLLSRTLAGAVPSALGVLASGFGMGPGVGSPAVTTETLCGVVCACCVPTHARACACVWGGLVLRTAWWTRACLRLFVWLCVVCVGQLVPVGLQALAGLPRPAYLPSGLLGAFHHRWVVWIPYLEAGFPLRCFQRLPFPNVANQPCPGRDNWHTRGSSVPVLSY